MSTTKIAITIDEKTLGRPNRMVKSRKFPSIQPGKDFFDRKGGKENRQSFLRRAGTDHPGTE